VPAGRTDNMPATGEKRITPSGETPSLFPQDSPVSSPKWPVGNPRRPLPRHESQTSGISRFEQGMNLIFELRLEGQRPSLAVKGRFE